MSDAQRIVCLPHIETPEDFKAEWIYSDSTEIKKDLKRCPKPVANHQIWAGSNNKDGDSSSDCGGALVLIYAHLGIHLWRGFQGKPMDLPVSWLTLAFGLSLFSVLSTRLALGIPIALRFEAWFVYQKTNKGNVVKYATDFGLVFLFLTLPTCFPMFAMKNAALFHLFFVFLAKTCWTQSETL